MIRLEFLLEESSMESLLLTLLPKILPPAYRLDENYFLHPFSGKSHLKRSLPKKMKVFSNFHEKTAVIILHDQDSNDCKKLKNELVQLCKENGTCAFLIRIVCRELEAWYLGDMEAIHAAYPGFKIDRYINKEKFRNPDLCNASDELRKILPGFQKGKSAVKIAPYMDISRNKSLSFIHFVSGLNKILS